MALINIMETIVRSKLDEILKTKDVCKCQTCYLDMVAMSLNSLKPKYVNTLKGELLVKINALERQNAIDIEVAILKAIDTVKKQPNHTYDHTKVTEID